MNYCARMPRRRSPGASNMIKMRRAQRSFGDGLIAEEVSDLCEDWMRHADQVLADEQMVAAVHSNGLRFASRHWSNHQFCAGK